MAGTVIVDTINSSVSGTPPVFQANGTQIGTLCRAWVNFNGTGTVAIRASFNVSSITDNGTGDYTVNFTNAMPDTNYSAFVTAGSTTTTNGVRLTGTSTTFSTGSVVVFTSYPTTTGGSSAGADLAVVSVAVFR